MRPDRFVFWCDECQSEHALDWSEIPCPLHMARVEKQNANLESQNNELDNKVMDLEDELAKLKP